MAMVFNRKPDARPMPVFGTAVGEAATPQPRVQAVDVSALSAQQAIAPESDAEREVESVIGNDFTIEGQSITIRCQGALRVNGNIQADLHSRKLVVGEEARINGAITAENVAVAGHVVGAIHGARVLLQSGAAVEGDIHAQYLTIEEGAAFDGRSRRVSDPSEVAPQLISANAAAPEQRPNPAASGPTPFTGAVFPGAARKVPA
jgi:cytoskeletal protein CcmA (bactofilin family)